MNKIISILLFIYLASQTFAQIDTIRKEFYPLQLGDVRQYQNQDNHLNTVKIRTDTIINGKQYYVLVGGGLRTQTGIMRIDSLMRVINRWDGPIGGDSCGGNTPYESSVYHLSEKDSTAWEICEMFSGIPSFNQLVRFNNISMQNIFGELHEVIQFDFGGVPFNEDTIWTYGAVLARGIGVIMENYYDGSYNILSGAIINGKQYGNIVSINEKDNSVPKEIVLYQNYPNPFNAITSIKYFIPNTSFVVINVFDVLGNRIANLVNEEKKPGIYTVKFNAERLSSGVYFYKIQTVDYNAAKKLILLK
jgi:hypothetical protein